MNFTQPLRAGTSEFTNRSRGDHWTYSTIALLGALDAKRRCACGAVNHVNPDGRDTFCDPDAVVVEGAGIGYGLIASAMTDVELHVRKATHLHEIDYQWLHCTDAATFGSRLTASVAWCE